MAELEEVEQDKVFVDVHTELLNSLSDDISLLHGLVENVVLKFKFKDFYSKPSKFKKFISKRLPKKARVKYLKLTRGKLICDVLKRENELWVQLHLISTEVIKLPFKAQLGSYVYYQGQWVNRDFELKNVKLLDVVKLIHHALAMTKEETDRVKSTLEKLLSEKNGGKEK